MFVFDVETLGKESNSVILSMAAIYFDPDKEPNHIQLRESAFFAKFKAEQQIKDFKRKVDKGTVEWWSKQCENARNKSFKPRADDIQFEIGYEAMRQWANTKNDSKCWVWARGNLDQLVLDSMEEQLELKPIWPFSRWRDVRTAIDFLYGTKNGYVEVDTPAWVEAFDSKLHITKHNPIDDCVFDAMQLMYGKKSQ
jgi:hypothetical protein